ncbi:MAG: hypothetical protein EXQ55_08965 [Acidobacteria bacterium]|nr:hypothetical protein [Acidobacteriota bacterium]
MRKLSVALAFVTLFALWMPASSQAQFEPVVDHIHIAAPDQLKAVEWYQRHFGGEQLLRESPERLLFGKARIVFMKSDKATPSAGSSVDHIGFSVPDLEASMKALVADGAKVVQPIRDAPGLFKLAFIEDPWGTKIEVVQDSTSRVLHHVHLRGSDPAAIRAWYAQHFGGNVGKLKGRLDGIEYSGVWLLVQEGAATPSQGHSIDHIGFQPKDVAASIAEMKARNVKVTEEPRPLKYASGYTVHIAFVEGPEGVRIEFVQR